MLKFITVTDEKRCKDLWETFNSKEILWDLWDFRFCFHKKNFSFNFILGLDGKNKVGLLPLVFDKNCDTYTYFGDTFPEQNKFFLRDKRNIKLFLENCPEDTQIYYIDSEEAKYYNFKQGDKRYFLNLKKYGNSFENYIKSFKKKHRKNFNYDLRKLRETGYSIEHNRIKDFYKLVEFNKIVFGKDSDYNEGDFVSSIKQLMGIANKKNILDMISIEVDKNTEAIGLSIFFNNVYYVLCIGRNPEIKNLGKLLITEQIKNAIVHNCNKIDFMSTESNWKELWNLDSERMYEFEK